VGIGTSSPASVLDVSGEAPTLTLRDSRTGGSWTAGTALGKLDFYTSDSTGIGAHSIASIGVVAGGVNTASPDGELVFATGSYNAVSQERMRIDSSGRVGIGRTSTSHALEVSGELKLASLGADEGIDVYNTNSVQWGIKNASATAAGVSFEVGNTERMRIDASGNVGIGTTSPATLARLDVQGGRAYFDSGSEFSIRLANSGTAGAFIGTSAVNTLNFYNGTGTERMRIDSSGNVGIGTDSPSRSLEVNSDSTQVAAVIGNNNSTRVRLTFKDANTTNDSKVGVGAEGDALIAHAGGAERMRIDDSGNLLVGTTSNSVYNDVSGTGIALNAGQIQIAGTGTPLYANRQGSDGNLIDFRKDGAAVGSIGASGGDIYIGTGDTTIRFADGDDAIIPRGTTGAVRDGVINLGLSNNRFKDLYLSGGVYLGGTGAANKLDDYEEGTWTPTLGGGATATGMTGTYTKVGRLVTAHLHLENSTISGTPDYIVSGLPFTSAANRTPFAVTYFKTFNVTCESVGGFVAGNTDTMQFLGMIQGLPWVTAPLTAGTGRYAFATAVYQTT